MNRVRDKVALVTGGAGGMGRAIARRLGDEGARIVVTDLDPANGADAVDALRADGVAATFLEHDVGDEASWTSVVEQAIGTFGRLDVLVNNAGVAARVGQPFDDIPFEEWKRVMRVNLDGAFLGTRAGVRAMKSTGGGSIVNIASIAGYRGTRGGAAYGSSKGGVRTLTKQAAFSCGKHRYNIRVNAIHPSYVWTPLVAEKAIKEFGSKEAAVAAFSKDTLTGRMCEPDDVAWAVVFLAAEESRQITGIDLVIDGGRMIS